MAVPLRAKQFRAARMLRSAVLLVTLSLSARAQNAEPQPPTTTAPAAPAQRHDVATSQPTASQSTTAPASQPAVSYSGDLFERPALTGDWWGVRNALAEKGVKFDAQVVQYLQGNAYGGKSTRNALGYSGTVDYALNFDTQKMGLWPGGFAKVRGETAFGRSINGKTGAISTPNFDALLPYPDDPGLTTLTEYWAMQFVSEQLGFIAGMVDLTALPGQNAFASDRYTQFLNTSLWQNSVGFATVPYAAMTAGAIYAPTKWFDGATLVVDSHGMPQYSGFETAFHGPHGATVLQAFNFHIKPFGLAGTQRFNFSLSTREHYGLEDIDRLLLAGAESPKFSRLGLARTRLWGGRNLLPRNILLRAALSRALLPDQRSNDWAFYYDFDQYLYTSPADPNQGFGVFGRFGWSSGEMNPIAQLYSLGLGGKGLVPTRPRDRYGLGYYCLNMSNDLPGILKANAEQGVELFYNIEVTPWLHITPDLQVIMNPGGNTGPGAREPAIVYGLRAQMSL
jgi:porin